MVVLEIKRYFLGDIDRIRIENMIVEWVPEMNKEIFCLDDGDLLEIYQQCLKEQSVL